MRSSTSETCVMESLVINHIYVNITSCLHIFTDKMSLTLFMTFEGFDYRTHTAYIYRTTTVVLIGEWSLPETLSVNKDHWHSKLLSLFRDKIKYGYLDYCIIAEWLLSVGTVSPAFSALSSTLTCNLSKCRAPHLLLYRLDLGIMLASHSWLCTGISLEMT